MKAHWKTMWNMRGGSAALIWILLFVCSLHSGRAQQVDPDATTLIAFKTLIVSDPTQALITSWNLSSLDANGCPRGWYGVNCSSTGRVASLSLDDLGLKGQISKANLGNLAGLSTLSLANNSFSGEIPGDLANLRNLTVLNLSHNLFTGNVPSAVVNLASLTNVSLSLNGLNGSIPSELGVNLTHLDFSNNNLTGALPNSLAELPQLVSLNLSSNNLDGEIPPGISNLTQLRALDLHRNRLSGSIGPALLFLKNIRRVDLSANDFSGQLPWEQSRASNPTSFNVVEYVNLSSNRINDTLERAGVVFTLNLQTLDLSDNLLSGTLPNFQYVKALSTLWLRNNSFSGEIPDELLSSIGAPIVDLDLSMNKLTGPLPSSIESDQLKTINLSRNMLSGSLPESLEGTCTSLDLSHNNFTGTLSTLESWDHLQVLDLSYNMLTGSLPDDYLIPLFSLSFLNISNNMLDGPLSNSFGSFKVLSVVDLSFNKLSGNVPSSFFTTGTVTYLSLASNAFSGPIPLSGSYATATSPTSSVTSMGAHLKMEEAAAALTPPTLSVLDLSGNNLNGSIPEQIGSFSSLQTLHLNSNNLSGRIPPQLNNLSKLHDLDLSGNDFSGPLPAQLPASLTALNVSENDLSGTVSQNLADRFNKSSFFPGNSGLLVPGMAAPQRGGGQTRGGSGGLTTSAKGGLIAGCIAGALLVLACGTYIVYHHRRSSKAHDVTSRSVMIEDTQKGMDNRSMKPQGNFEPDFDGDLEHGGTPHVLPVPMAVPGKSASGRTGKIATENGGSPEVKLDDDMAASPSPGTNHRFPIVTEDVMSPEHPLVSKVSPEHPIVDKDASSDRGEQLVGDVVFLDRALSFSAEDLSRAPAVVLGRSNHGTSYKATLGPDHVLVVKWLKGELAKNRKEFGMEARKFGNVKHPNIVAIKGYYWGPREHEKLIFSNYMNGGSLAGRLQERTDTSLPALSWPQRLKIAVDVSRGLMDLHASPGWPHGNIKATNVLLIDEPSKFGACVSDYSLHRLMTPAGIVNQVVNLGALGYCAPELALAKKPKPSLKADVFSFGVILMELITGKNAGDIISGSTGIVDLPDWVRVVANEGHAIDCYDTALVGVDRDLEPPEGIDVVLALSMSCAGPQSSRPTMRAAYERLSAINPD